MTAVASLLLRLARHVAPRHRLDWIHAMEAELAHVAPGDSVPFAAGCVLAALQQRTAHMSRNLIAAAQVVCLAASAALAVLGCANAMRLGQQDFMLGLIFAFSGAIWGAAFVALAFKSWRAVAFIAVAGLGISVAQGLATVASVPALQPGSSLILALALEGIVLFGTLLGAALLFGRKPGQRHF